MKWKLFLSFLMICLLCSRFSQYLCFSFSVVSVFYVCVLRVYINSYLFYNYSLYALGFVVDLVCSIVRRMKQLLSLSLSLSHCLVSFPKCFLDLGSDLFSIVRQFISNLFVKIVRKSFLPSFSMCFRFSSVA